MRARLATLLLAAGVYLGGCAAGLGGSGVSVGAGYGSPYGYGNGSQYGYGSRYGYSPYGYSPYGYGSRYGYNPYRGYGSNPYYVPPYYGSPWMGYYGSPYSGWYDGFYYPGNGYYVYDRNRNRRRINEADRRRWMQGVAESLANSGRQRQATTSNSTSTRSTTRLAPPSGTRATRARIEARERARAEARELRATRNVRVSGQADVRRRARAED